jgi:hypothetical protein
MQQAAEAPGTRTAVVAAEVNTLVRSSNRGCSQYIEGLGGASGAPALSAACRSRKRWCRGRADDVLGFATSDEEPVLPPSEVYPPWYSGGDDPEIIVALEKVPGPHLCMRQTCQGPWPFSTGEKGAQFLYTNTQSASINTKETGDTPQGNETQRELEAVASGIKSASGWIHEDDVLLCACSMRGLEVYP